MRSLLLPVIVVCACKPPEMPRPDSGMNPPPGCPIAFTHRALASASSVVVVGEWNQFDRLAHPLRDSAGNGTWSGTFNVPPGRWAYAFLENGAQAADPEQTYIRYVDG